MASPQLPPPSGSPEDTESGWQFVQRPTVSFTSLRTSGEQYLRRDSDTISDHGMHHDIRQEHFDCCHETENVNTSVEPAPEPDEATFVEYTRPASALLRVMSLLDPELIGSHLLFPVSATAEQCGYPATARNFTIARDELRQKSLISLTPGGNGLCMQRHIQDEVVTQLQANDQFCVFFVVVVEMVAASWPSGVTLQRPDESPQNRYSRWMNCEGLLPHVLKLKQTFEGMDNVDAKTCTTHHLVLLSIEVAWYYFERSNYLQANALVDFGFLAYAQAYKYSPQTVPLLADLHGTRAATAIQTGEQQSAISNAEMQLAYQRQVSNNQLTSRLANAHNELGNALLINWRFAEAAASFDIGASILQFTPGFQRLDSYSYLVGHGTVFYMKGEHDKAFDRFERALGEREKAYGQDDREGIRSGELLYALGNVCNAQGRLDDSFANFRLALKNFQETVDSHHSSTAKACYKLALHYLRVRDYQSASALLHQVLPVYESAPYYRPQLARVHFKISQVLNAQCMNNAWDAQASLNYAWDIRRLLVPGDMRSPLDLEEEDFDRLVVLWAR